MSVCERNIRHAYAHPHLRGERSRIARFERYHEIRRLGLPRWTKRRTFLMANAGLLGLSVRRASDVLEMPVWGVR